VLASRLRRDEWREWSTRALLGALPIVIAWTFVPAFPHVAAADVCAIGALLGVGFVAGSWITKKTVLPLIATTLVSLTALEIGARWIPQRAARFAQPDEMRFVFDTPPALATCAAMYPDALPGAFRARTAHLVGDGPVVLHVGDSMVEGVGVPIDTAFPAVLARLRPGAAHVNAGFANSSIDAELLVARAWLGRLRVRRVVLYVFGYNDIAEIDRISPCCPGGPLLASAPGLAARCRVPARVTARLDRLVTSPAPYALRVATSASAFARQAVIAWTAVGEVLSRHGASLPDAAARWRRYDAMLAALQREVAARHIPLSVVYLPARTSFERGALHDASDREAHDRIAALCRAHGIEMLDPWEAIASEVRRVGIDRVYLRAPDIHFTVEGHRALAEWLAAHLPP
jgi:lysophospholipase L1-like esterase